MSSVILKSIVPEKELSLRDFQSWALNAPETNIDLNCALLQIVLTQCSSKNSDEHLADKKDCAKKAKKNFDLKEVLLGFLARIAKRLWILNLFGVANISLEKIDIVDQEGKRLVQMYIKVKGN